MPTKRIINIAKDFSRSPSGRFRTDGEFSGEHFRDEYLVPALSECGQVEVQISGTRGYGSSFLEEAFGGLIRVRGYTAEDLASKLKLTISDPAFQIYIDDINQYIKEAQRERDGHR